MITTNSIQNKLGHFGTISIYPIVILEQKSPPFMIFLSPAPYKIHHFMIGQRDYPLVNVYIATVLKMTVYSEFSH
jgi:hypothetical protein